MTISKSEQLDFILKDVQDAIALCYDPIIQGDLGGVRVKMFAQDLNALRAALKGGAVDTIDVGAYSYFNGSGGFDTQYKPETKALFDQSLKVLNGIIFYRLIKA